MASSLLDLTIALDAADREVETAHNALRDAAARRDVLAGQEMTAWLDAAPPAEQVWSDPALLAEALRRAWANGRGAIGAHKYLAAAIDALSPGDFYGFSFGPVTDQDRGLTLRPVLTLDYHQDVTTVAAAIEVMLPSMRALAEDGDVQFDVLDHTCGYGMGSWMLRVGAEGVATVVRANQVLADGWAGTVPEALAYLADRAWWQGGPVKYDDEDERY